MKSDKEKLIAWTDERLEKLLQHVDDPAIANGWHKTMMEKIERGYADDNSIDDKG